MSEYWEQENTDGDVFYDLWKKFWGKPLVFEQDVTVASVDDNEDDEERMEVDNWKSFKVLTIGAGALSIFLQRKIDSAPGVSRCCCIFEQTE